MLCWSRNLDCYRPSSNVELLTDTAPTTYETLTRRIDIRQNAVSKNIFALRKSRGKSGTGEVIV